MASFTNHTTTYDLLVELIVIQIESNMYGAMRIIGKSKWTHFLSTSHTTSLLLCVVCTSDSYFEPPQPSSFTLKASFCFSEAYANPLLLPDASMLFCKIQPEPQHRLSINMSHEINQAAEAKKSQTAWLLFWLEMIPGGRG